MAERDFNLQMTGEQVKDALQQLEDRVAEGWAVGEHDGVPVTSGSPYYHNNSAWWAQQAGLSAQAAADSAATAEQEVEEGIRQGIVGAYVQESATPGAIVTIDDGADDVPLKDLKVNLAINQPLHGQANPYPAGGGKNLIPNKLFNDVPSISVAGGLTMTVDGYKFKFNGTSTAQGGRNTLKTLQFDLPAGTYTLSMQNGTGLSAFVQEGTTIVAGTSSSFTLTETKSVSITFNVDTAGTSFSNQLVGVQLEAGSTATDWSPYENVCPIYPVTEAEVSRTGKNLDFKTIAGNVINSTGTIASNASYDVHCAYVKAGQTYIVSNNGSALTGLSYSYYDKEPVVNLSALTGRLAAPNGVIAATMDAYIAIVALAGSSKVQIEKGSTATAYEAYKGTQYLVNIGINQWDEQTEIGAIDASTGADTPATNVLRSTNYYPCVGGESLYVHSNASTVYLFFYDKSKTFLRYTTAIDAVKTFPANAAYFRIQTSPAYGTTYLNNISINYPSRFTDYHAYTGNVVYGGELDVTAGVLTAKYKKIVLDGTENWSGTDGGDMYAINDANYLDGRVQSVGKRIKGFCSHIADVIVSGNWYIDPSALSPNSSIGTYLNANDMQGTAWGQSFATLASWKAYLAAQAAAGTPVTYIYELATPISIQLTPTEIDTLRGDNVIWADCGDITNCEYRADLKMYIDKVVGA